ncbi:MAG: 16S rRNA (cytosine(1402)-N(4))-methyltransferase RsmH [Chloroflexi bacterium]|nr:16S rRNA (cytosine(1402)-N(4))-methyltransferase RsmH [Chloroflexota bacterium]
MTSTPTHVPVLLNEALEFLAVRPGGSYIDGTTGLGGHSEAIATAMGPGGHLLCIDQDREALEFARTKLAAFGSAINFVHGNFRELAEIARRHGFSGVDGILLDLGVSSLQFGSAERGFAFALEGPLDMRMDQASGDLTAGEIVNTWDESSLADLFYHYGEERQSRRIAAAVVRARPLQTTWELARAVEQAVGGVRRPTQIHPATKVFLALRIRVNRELDSVDAVLPQAHGLLGFGTDASGGGRMVVISFHSLEDRIVKTYMRRESTNCICPPELPVCRCGHVATLRLLTRRAVRPSPAEVAANPRSRSAVLRAAERVA